MDFIDQIKVLAEKVEKMRDQIQTEEATKNAFIMPFIQTLGYDVFNPNEVVPEFVADIGVKKGEKVDYAIMRDGHPIILIECKHWSEDLLRHNEQLFRYFSTVSQAKFGILTNGVKFMFFTDLAEPNKMDSDPFLVFDITNISDLEVEELKKFHKSYFQVEAITSAANDLKYSNLIKSIFTRDLKLPSEAFVKYFISQVYQGRATEKVTTYFTDLVKKSLQQVVTDLITDRLKNALSQESSIQAIPTEAPESGETSSESPVEGTAKIITTEEELESFQIVKAILRTKVPVQRIFYRDGQTYFSVILDDNNRKPICRMYFNGVRKFVGVFDSEKHETRVEIQSLDDLFNLAPQLEQTVASY